jgi:hypothetical protein
MERATHSPNRSGNSFSVKEHPWKKEREHASGRLHLAVTSSSRSVFAFLRRLPGEKHLLLTEHPNALPASERCPG